MKKARKMITLLAACLLLMSNGQAWGKNKNAARQTARTEVECHGKEILQGNQVSGEQE